jgi:GTP pyrophosphokinase
VRRQYAGLGRQIVERAFERAGKAFSEDTLRAALPRLARGSIEDVLAAVGRGEMFSGDVVRAIYPDHKEERTQGPAASPDEEGWFGIEGSDGFVFRAAMGEEAGSARSIPIRGLERDMPVRFGAGGAVPGDRIVGIHTPGQGITIYPIHSPALAEFETRPELWLDVRWDVEAGASRRFPARIQVTSINEPGTLAAISRAIADHDGNIDNVVMRRRSADFTETTIDLGVFDLKHLNAILAELRAKRIVNAAERVTG